MKTAIITISLQIKDSADIQNVINDLDYSITHPEVIDAEIIDAEFDEDD